MSKATKASILIAEDEESLRETLKLNLELEGYEATTVETGPNVVKAVKNEYFDLIAKRKAMLFQGNEEEAAKLLELAEELVDSGKVSDDEMLAAAYI
jgi:CheY-like chemotaxis protein